MAENKKLQSDIVIVKNVNHTLEEMGEQCSHRNNREISGIPNSIPGKDLENTVISICNDSGVEIDQKDIEGCHRLPLSRNSSGQDKRVIVSFVIWKDSKALSREKSDK